MSSNQVQITVSAVDKASNVISGITKGAVGGFTELNSMLGLASQAFGTVQKAIDATVGEVLTYDKTVRDLSRNLGTSTEETSKLIQVADDYKVEVGTLENAMKLALKNGFTPTIDNLADLADKYVELESPTERASMLSEIFGKNWAAITPILEDGGDALRQAAAEMDTALIRTQEQVDASRELEVQMDSLTDKLYGYKLAIGTAVIPATNDALNAFNDWTEGTENLWSSFTSGETTLKDFLAQGYALNGVISELTHGRFKEAKEGAEKLLDKIDELGDKTKETTDATKEYSLSTSAMTTKQGEAKESTDKLKFAQLEAETATEQHKLAEERLNSALDNLKAAIAGPIGEELESFKEKQNDLQTEADEWKGKIDELNAKTYLTDDQKEELEEAKTKYGEVTGAIKENADEHDEATKRILFNMLEQRAAVDGFTQDELTFLDKVASEWGLIDENTLTASQGMDAAWKLFVAGDVNGAIEKLGEVRDAAVAIPKEITIKVGVEASKYAQGYDQYVPAPGAKPSGPTDPRARLRASGGPVSAGGAYIVGEEGPEMFVPSQSGTILPNNVVNNFNMTVNTNAPSSTVISDFNIMRALAGV
jgi:uncharacterized coiled-coil DUF342 family protein